MGAAAADPRSATRAMFTGVGPYLIIAAVVGVISHGLSQHFLAGSLMGAAASAALNLAHETYEAGGQLNLGWAPFLLVAAFVLALPATLAAGVPFLLIRHRRDDVWSGAADLR